MYYYEEDSCTQPDCHECDKAQDIIREAGDHLRAVLEMLYENTALDTSRLENHLDEAQHLLGVRFEFPDHQPKVIRHRSKIFNFGYLLTNPSVTLKEEVCL